MAQNAMKQKNDPGLGIEFEVLLPAYLCLKLLETEEVEDFSIESNAEGFGNVDDLIIHIKKRDQEELFFALQLKHADNANAKLYPNNLWKTFAKFDEEKRKYCIILFTNRKFDAAKVKDVQNFTMEQNDNCKGKTYFDTSAGKSIYKFSLKDTSQISSDLTRNDFQKFLEKFSLYTSQCSSRKLDQKIREILSNNYFGNKSSASVYIDFFRSWHKNEFRNKKLTKRIVQVQLIRILLSSCIEHGILIPKPQDDCRKSEILKEVINSFDIIPTETHDFNKVDGNEDVNDSNILKLAKDLKIVKKDAEMLTLDEHYDTLVYTGQTPAFILWNETTMKLITAVLNKILRQNRKILMKMILCGKYIDLNVLSGFRVFNNLRDLHAKDKNLFFKVLKHFEISIQGRENILIDEESSQFITAEDVFKSFNGKLTIGTKSSIVIEHYVPRVLATTCVSLEFISQVKRDLLVIDCGENLEETSEKLQENTMKTVLKLEEFLHKIKSASTSKQFVKELDSAIIITNSEAKMEIFSECQSNVHFLKALDEDSFQWIASRGDIQNLRRGNKYRIKEVKEEDVCDVFKKNNVNVICAEPGMGKSVLMEVLKKYTPRDHWAVKIDFRECSQMLEAFSKNQDWEETFYKQVFEKNEGGGKRFKDLFLKQQKIYIFFDGLDELQSMYVETAIKLIEVLISRGFKIWISSRRNFRELLEARFNVFSLNIQEFSEKVQRNYIKNRLNSFYDLKNIQEITQKIFDNAKIINNSIILGIPLQLSMLTEIFIQNKDSAKEFSEKIFIMTEMFESFFRGRIKHYLLKKTSKTEALEEDYINMIRSYFEIAGLKSCLDESFYETLKITESKAYCKFIESDPSKLGIITSVNDDRVPVFQHNTYGEYFAACYFAENYEAIDLSRLFEPKYNNIRLMFDLKLAHDSSPHLAVIYKDLDKLKTFEDLNCKDKGGRTPLHLACCYGEKFPQLEVKNRVIKDNSSDGIDKKNLELNNEVIRFLRNSEIDLFAKDKVFEWNSLQYSDATMNLAAIDILIGDKVADLVGLKNSLQTYLNNYESLMYYASKFNFRNLFKMLKKLINGRYKINVFKSSYFRGLLKLKTKNNESLLHVAVENRSLEMVALLLDEGIAINAVDEYGRTAFDIAFLVKDEEIQLILDSKGATANCLQEYEKNPLQWAAKNNFIKIIKLILNEESIDIDNGDHVKWTALHHAVFYGHLQIIEFLLDSGADIEARSINNQTPLHLGIRYGQVEATNLLLMKGAARDRINNNGDTPLHYAIIRNQEVVLKLLLKENFNVNARNDAKETALHIALKNNNVDTLKLLLTQEEINIESRDGEGKTPLLIAAMLSSLEAFFLLLEKGADVNAISDSGETVLHLLMRFHNKKKSDFVCKLLATSKINVNAQNHKGETILHEATCYENVEVVKFLLTRKEIDIESKDKKGNTPLLIAAMSSSLDAFHLLLKKDADVNAINDSGETVLHLLVSRVNKESFDLVCKLLPTSEVNVNLKNLKGETILHQAVRYEILEVVKFLLSHDEIDIESRNKQGNTPLLIAARFSSLESFRLLLEKGADVNAINDSGKTVLHWVVSFYNKEKSDFVCKLLATSKINVNIKNLIGENILHQAARYENLEVVKFLLTHKEIDIESQDEDGDTPLHIAARFATLEATHFLLEKDADLKAAMFSNLEIIDLLLEKGADVNAVNNFGETVLYLLMRNRDKGRSDIVCKLLSTSKINVNVKNLEGEPMLHEAIRYKNLEVVKFLLTHGEIDIESRNQQGNTPLLIAVMSANLEALHLILEKGADVNAINDSGETVLHLLVQNCDEKKSDLVCELLPTSKINVNVKNLKGETILHQAIRCKNLEVVKFLLTHEKIDIESKDKDGDTPLLIAARFATLEATHFLLEKDADLKAAMFSNLEIVDLLLEKGADVNAVNDFGETVLYLLMRNRDKGRSDIVCELLPTSKINVNVKNLEGKTILHEAIYYGNVEVVKFLLTHEEIDIESKDKQGNTPLLIAAMSSSLDAFHLLLDKGADVNAISDSSETVLHFLVQYRNKKTFDLVCKLLSTSKINVNAKNLEGETILHESIVYRNVKLVKLLLAHEETDRESRDKGGNTPLLIAVMYSSLEAFQLLLEKGADVNAINDSGETILHLLVQYHNNKKIFDLVCKLLIKSKINVNVKNLEGKTILHEAIYYGNVEVVKFLLTHEEIDIESKDKQGNTPLLIAAMFSRLEAFHLLLEKGADVNAISDSGENILHWLVQHRTMEKFDLVCKLLSTSKINVDVKILEGKTIIHEAICNLLRECRRC